MHAVVDDTTPRAAKTMGQILVIKGRRLQFSGHPKKSSARHTEYLLEILNG